jgi:hypothetical protein
VDKRRKSNRQWSDYCVREARQGNPWPLIGRLRSGMALTEAERDLVAEALEAKAGKRGSDLVRRAEAALIARQVEVLAASGMKIEAAVEEVAKQRDRSRRHVYNAIAVNRKRGGLF